MFQRDVGPVFTVAHAVSERSWFNDMQVIRILKGFQMLSTAVAALAVNIFLMCLGPGNEAQVTCCRGLKLQ